MKKWLPFHSDRYCRAMQMVTPMNAWWKYQLN